MAKLIQRNVKSKEVQYTVGEDKKTIHVKNFQTSSKDDTFIIRELALDEGVSPFEINVVAVQVTTKTYSLPLDDFIKAANQYQAAQEPKGEA